jgi:hypothetical protein
VRTDKGSHQYVCIKPFPLAITWSERAVNQCLFLTIHYTRINKHTVFPKKSHFNTTPHKDIPFSCLLNKIRCHLTHLDFVAFSVTFHSRCRVHSLYVQEWREICEKTVGQNKRLRRISSSYQIYLRTSPNNWNRAFSPRNTPAVVGPEFNPIRRDRSEVPYHIKQLDICLSSFLR